MLLLSFLDDWAAGAFELLLMLIININGFIYDLASFLFEVFISVTSARIMTASDYAKIANSVYLVIGIITLFIIAYALLRAIIDPDGAAKQNYSAKKIIPNILISIILIAVVPTIFNNAFRLQEIVISTNIIPNVVFGMNLSADDNTGNASDTNGSKFKISTAGRQMANDVFISFFTPSNIAGTPDNLDSFYASIQITNCWLVCYDGVETFEDAKNKVVNEGASFGLYGEFADAMYGKDPAKHKLDYNFLLQLICGCFLVYVLANFCIDMAVRSVKLGYFQIIAPIPILTIMIPGQKKIFDNWLKSTISTFVDVFLRIFIIFFGVLLINTLPSTGNWSGSAFDISTGHPGWARALIIVGILIFMKQAPKLIADIFGISSGSFKLGIKDKLGEMALVGDKTKEILSRAQGAATGALGAGWTSKVNGGSFRKGMKYGIASGWSDGARNPNQFNAQRQNIYKNGMGYKGKVGWFGGQNRMDKWMDDTKNKYSDDYKDRILSAKVNAAENYANPNSLIRPHFERELNEKVANQRRLITEAAVKRDDKEAKLNTVRQEFETKRQENVTKLRDRLDATNIGLSNKVWEMKEKFDAVRDADKNDLLTRRNTMTSEHFEELRTEKETFEQKKAVQLQNLQTQLQQQQQAFDLNKKKELGVAKAELDNAKSLGDLEKIREFTDKVNKIQNSNFNGDNIQNQINQIRNAKYENTDAYLTKNSEYQHKLDEFNRKIQETESKSFYNTKEYNDMRNDATAETRGIMDKLQSFVDAKVEDSEEYKQANAEYEEALNSYILENEKLNERTEVIKKWVWDPKKGKKVEKVYNPHATSEADRYVDADDEAAVQAAMVSSVEAEALKAAIKDLQDANETYKSQKRVDTARNKEKANEEWFQSDEGQHLNYIFGKNAGKVGEGVKIDAPKEDKK